MPDKIWRMPYTATQIQEAIGKGPVIRQSGDSYTWWTWDIDAGQYVDTGVVVNSQVQGANENEVFIAEYGVTTNVEIQAAIDAGKVVFVKYDVNLLPIFEFELEDDHYFLAGDYLVNCYQNEWTFTLRKYTPTGHASTHASDGSDPITPAAIGAAPAFTYGTEDLVAGSSALATGTQYLVYE